MCICADQRTAASMSTCLLDNNWQWAPRHQLGEVSLTVMIRESELSNEFGCCHCPRSEQTGAGAHGD